LCDAWFGCGVWFLLASWQAVLPWCPGGGPSPSARLL